MELAGPVGPRILVIDDAPELLQATCRILRAARYEVFSAGSGEEGLALAREIRPDMILVDVVMPDMDGLELCAAVREVPDLRDTALILISSIKVTSADQAAGMEQGVCEYIARPMPNREFLARIESAMRDKEAVDGLLASRLELEQELQSIFSNAPVCLFLTDGNARLSRSNPAFERMFGSGLESVSDQLCGPALHCIHTGDDPRGCGFSSSCQRCVVRNAIEDTFASGSPHRRVVGALTVRSNDHNEERFVELSTSRVEVKGEHRVIICLYDVTEQRVAEHERDLLQQQLQQAQRMESVGRLAGGVAHDFNNLLAVILGYAFILDEETSLAGAHREPLEEITAAALRAKELTRQLLAFSRRQVLEVKGLDLNRVTTDFEKLLGRLIGEDIELRLHLAEEELPIQADGAQLEQVLMNLTVNARDAMPNGGAMSIRTSREVLQEDRAELIGVRSGAYATLSVQDTGCGIPSEVLGSIFEPFFTTKDKDKGTGLGLSTAYGIVEQHHGTIRVRSEPAKGATFVVYLPLSDAVSFEYASLQSAESAVTAHALILVVEDDDRLRRLVRRVLSKGGYHVTTCSSGELAVEQARAAKQPFHLVVSDLILPGINGRETVNEIQALHPSSKSIFMSGYADDVISRHGVMEEGLHFVQKPFTVSGLLEKVASVLQS